MGKLYQKIDGSMVEVPLAQPDDNVPVLMALNTTTIDPDQPANVTMVQLGTHIYGLNFDVPRGGTGKDVIAPEFAIGTVTTLPSDQAVKVDYRRIDDGHYELDLGLPRGMDGTGVEDFSTGEKHIGTWIDGRALYRQAIEAKFLTKTKAWNYMYAASAMNIREIASLRTLVRFRNYITNAPFFVSASEFFAVRYNMGMQSFDEYHSSSDYDEAPVTLIVDYTKV